MVVGVLFIIVIFWLIYKFSQLVVDFSDRSFWKNYIVMRKKK